MTVATVERQRSVNVTVKLYEVQRERMRALAAYKKRTPHFLMIDAIDKYIQDGEREQAMLKMVDEGNEHFERTGLHVTTTDIRTWLAAVKLNPSTPRPACHL
jgi:predicted transcriptional regulator